MRCLNTDNGEDRILPLIGRIKKKKTTKHSKHFVSQCTVLSLILRKIGGGTKNKRENCYKFPGSQGKMELQATKESVAHAHTFYY